MVDSLAGYNLQTAGFARLVNTAIHRDVVNLLRYRAVYADPQAILPLNKVPGSSFVHRATLWTDVAPTLAALAEGVPPSPLKMSEDDIEVTVSEVGDYIPVFSQAEYQDGGALNLVANATKKIARMIELAYDTTARTLYLNSTNAIYGGSGNTASGDIAAGDVLTSDLVDEAVAIARESDLEPFDDGLYRFVGNPRQFVALLSEAGTNGSGFAPAANQGTVGDLKRGVIGDYHGARFISAGSRGIVKAAVGTGSIDVYRAVLYGKQAIAMSDMSSIQTIVQPGGGPTDPLRQIVATIGFRGFIGGALVELANDSDGSGVNGSDVVRHVVVETAAA